MDKNLQNIDDLFNKAYQYFEEKPTKNAWDKINAALDKEDAHKYKRRLIGWKRIAVSLSFILTGIIIYQTGLILKGSTNKGLAESNKIVDNILTEKNKIDQEVAKRNNKDITGDTQGISHAIKNLDNRIDFIRPVSTTNHINAKISDSQKSAAIISEVLDEQRNTVKAIHKELKGRFKISISTINPAVVDKNDNTGLVNNTATGKSITPVKNELYGTTLNADEYRNHPPKLLVQLPETKPVYSSSFIPYLIKPITLPPALSLKINSKAVIKNTVAANIKPGWALTAFVSNDWSQYQLDNDAKNNTSNYQNEREKINNRETHEASFSVALLATWQINKHVAFKIGFIYSNTAIAIAPQEMYAAKQSDGNIAYKFITSSGYGFIKPAFGPSPALGDSIKSAMAQHNFQVLSVPLMASYKFGKNKFSVAPSAGISANFITSANVKTEVIDAVNHESVTISRLDGMRSFFAGIIGDVNFQYNCNKRWSVNLLSAFKYAITPITRNNVVKTFPYSFSIGAGVTYKF